MALVEKHGANVSAFASVSADPPTVMVCLRSDSRIAKAVVQNKNFAACVLAKNTAEMAISELSTAVDHGINTVTVVMDNGCWGAEKAYQRDFFNGRYIGVDVSSPDFCQGG